MIESIIITDVIDITNLCSRINEVDAELVDSNQQHFGIVRLRRLLYETNQIFTLTLNKLVPDNGWCRVHELHKLLKTFNYIVSSV